MEPAIMRSLRPVAVGLLALAALAQAPAQAKPVQKSTASCFWTRDVQSYTTQGEEVVNVRVGVRDVYRLDLLGPCHDIDWPLGIALVSKGGGAICSPHDADVLVRSDLFGPQRCPVRAIRKLTPQEVAGLPKKARP